MTRLPAYALFDLKGPKEAIAAWAKDLPDFPTSPNSVTRALGLELCHLGPSRWLLRGSMAQEEALLERLRPEDAPPEISIVRVSDTQTFFRITGPDAAEILSIGCPLDLHPDVFGPEAISYTEFFGLKALVLRCEGGFECAVEQSFGDMVEDYVTRILA